MDIQYCVLYEYDRDCTFRIERKRTGFECRLGGGKKTYNNVGIE